MAVPLLLDSYPASGAAGIPIGDSITITFDQEMDESSINDGTFVLAAPANDTLFGPGLEPIAQQFSEDRDDILTPPEFGSYVKGTITFTRIDVSGSPVDDSEVDYTGQRTLWRTVATFTPDQPLRPTVEYTVIIAGDEDQTNGFDSGIRNRTVFDANPISVSGTGYPIFSGGYTGSQTRTYTLEITAGGATGTATYTWWNNATPLDTYEGVTTTGLRELEDGLVVSFSPDGGFTVGDQWTVVVLPYETLTANYSWTFTTGSGSIQIPPSTSSATGLGTIPSMSGSISVSSNFYVSSIDPSEGEYGVDISTDPYIGEVITIVFSDTLDTSTVTTSTVTVETDSPLGDDSIATLTEDLSYTIVVSGTTITITLEPGQLYQNNIVVITLDKSIANTDGDALGSDYVSYFATTYTPLYTGIRRIMLDIGSVLSTTIKDETIYLAILEASLQAEAFSYVTSIGNVKLYNLAKQEYTACLAERILVSGVGFNSDKLSKRLGDLSVSRGVGDDNLKDELANCIEYWELPLKSGGNIDPNGSVSPRVSVKGAWASDRITVSRQWEPTNRIFSYRSVANTTKSTRNSRRRQRTYRTRYSKGGS